MHPGRGPGLTPRQLGQVGGVNEVTLSVAQMPNHGHDLPVVDGPASSGTPASSNTLAVADTRVYATARDLEALGDQVGGGQAHENRQPYLGLNFIIALVGLYPSRS
jgi:microcystin-dependent protein